MRRLLAITLLVVLAACSGKWQHPSKKDVDFEKDRAECEALAKQAAKDQTLTGRRSDIQIYYRTLNLCLYGKGWSNIPPAAEAGEPGSAKPLTGRTGKRGLRFAGQAFQLLEGATITKKSFSSYGPVRMEAFDFSGRKDDLIYQGQLIFQKSYAQGFDPADYPISEPFFTYERGRMENGIRWNSYAVRLDNGSWIGGVGAYWLISKEDRVVISVITALPPQKDPPPERCRLSRVQGQAMERLLGSVLPWLNSLGEKERSWLPFLKWQDYKITVDF